MTPFKGSYCVCSYRKMLCFVCVLVDRTGLDPPPFPKWLKKGVREGNLHPGPCVS